MPWRRKESEKQPVPVGEEYRAHLNSLSRDELAEELDGQHTSLQAMRRAGARPTAIEHVQARIDLIESLLEDS